MPKNSKKRKKWNIGSIWQKGMPEKIRKKISEKAKERYKARAIWNKGRKWSKETRNRISKAKKKSFRKNPALLKRMSSISKKRWKDPKFRALVDRKCTEFWRNHPNLKKQYSKKMKEHFKNNPEALKDLLNYSKKSAKPHLKTKQGFKVRSKGEQLIANFLKKQNIPCLYEAIPLMFKEMIPIPDFYIPSLNVFIEFYGGHPKSWKTKVQKSQLYKKHKIPVLAITPAELNNLNYFLLRQGEQLSESKLSKDFDIYKWIRD